MTTKTKSTIVKIFHQAVVMLVDPLLIVAVLWVFLRIGIGGGLIVLLMAWYAQSQSGGWFLAWRPKNIRAFWRSLP